MGPVNSASAAFGRQLLLYSATLQDLYKRGNALCLWVVLVFGSFLFLSFAMPGRLKIQRPSPTTVSFTVSNAPQRSSSPAKVFFGLEVLLRAVFFLCVIAAGITLLRHLVFKGDTGVISWPLVWSSALGSQLCRLVDSYNPLAIAVVSTLVIYGVFRRGYTGMLEGFQG